MKKLFIIFGIQIACVQFSIAQVQLVNGAIIQGDSVEASGTKASAIGYKTQATGNYSFASGNGTMAIGNMSFAGGWNASAEGSVAFAFGDYALAKHGNTIALGGGAQAYRPNGIAIGNNVVSGQWAYPDKGRYAICIGNESFAQGDYSFAFGQYVTVSADNAIVIGKGYMINQNLVNNISNSIALGMGSTLPTLFISGSASATATGKVGIGITNLGSKFQVNGGAAIGYSNSTAAPENGLLVNGNVGIGTTTITEKLTVNGNIQVLGNDNGLILSSPDGSTWKLTIDNSGIITTTKITAVNEKIINEDKIEVFPNPANDMLQIKLNDTPVTMPVAIELRSMENVLMYYQVFNQKEFTVNLQTYTTGSYILLVKDGNGQVMKNSVLIKQ